MLRYSFQKRSAPLSKLVSRWAELVDDPMRPHIRQLTNMPNVANTFPSKKLLQSRVDASVDDIVNQLQPYVDSVVAPVKRINDFTQTDPARQIISPKVGKFLQSVIDTADQRNIRSNLRSLAEMRNLSLKSLWGLGDEGGVAVSTSLPLVQQAALTGHLQAKRFSDVLPTLQQAALDSKAESKGLNALVGMHELFEYGTRKHQGTRKPFFSHMGPRVLTAESNMLARLTPDEMFDQSAVDSARRTVLGLRDIKPSGLGVLLGLTDKVTERKVMENAVNAVTGGRFDYKYGQTHLPKAVRKRVENYLISQYGGPLG